MGVPGTLNTRADREPIASCPVDFYAASLSSYSSRPLALRPLAAYQLQVPLERTGSPTSHLFSPQNAGAFTPNNPHPR